MGASPFLWKRKDYGKFSGGFPVDITVVENLVESVKNSVVTRFVTGCNLCYFLREPVIIFPTWGLFVNPGWLGADGHLPESKKYYKMIIW